MRSIRRTLIVSFVALFAAALAGVAVTLDRLADQALAAREHAATEFIETQYADRCRDEREKFDDRLLTEARALGSQMQSQYAIRFEQENQKFRHVVFPTLEHFATANPFARLGWVGANSHRGSLYFATARGYFAGLHLDDLFLSQVDHGGGDPGLYQINLSSRNSPVWRSPSLEGHRFPGEATGFDPNKAIDWKYDDQTVNGVPVRRIVFRSPIILPWGGGFRVSFPARPGGRGDRPPPVVSPMNPMGPPPAGGPPGPPPPGPTTAQFLEAVPKITVYCARPVAGLDARLAAHAADRDAQLAQLRETIRADRRKLRGTVFSVGVVALTAIVAGGTWLVRRGLTPLDRLSDAVGRVNEKDFRLPVGPAELTTELIPIHARLTETLDQLKRAFDREKQAVADISHELRTPVAALLTTLDVALRKPRAADQYRQTLEECRAITRQLGQLVERVMTLAYLDAGQTRITRGRVAAADLAAGCAAVIRPLAEARGLTVTLKADPDLELDTDRDKLREVLMNLLHNAVEYNNPGGAIELAVSRNGGGRVAFDVRDTGIGMSDEVRGKIFERFYRADPSRTETGVHAGLGLAIVKEYVERLGGTIAVESAPGEGSRFRVELPAADDANHLAS